MLLVMMNICLCTALFPNFNLVGIQHSSYKQSKKFLDSNQLASAEASRSGSTLFFKEGIYVASGTRVNVGTSKARTMYLFSLIIFYREEALNGMMFIIPK